MLHAPEKYLNSIISKAGIEKNITFLVHHFIINNNCNLHFIIDEKELELSLLLTKQSLILNSTQTFDFQIGQRVVKLKNPDINYSKSALQTFFCPFKINDLGANIKIVDSENQAKTVENLNKFIPITNCNIERVGIIQNRIDSFQEIFNAKNQSDYFCNEKLLVIGNRNLYLSIPKDFPACYVSKNRYGNTEIEYNSPILPKIAILKNINLLDNYQQQEINGEQVTFSTCIFVGSSKFENSINIIRNYYNQRRFTKVIFIGEKDIRLDLGNNQIPLRWKWSIPEINFFKGERNIQHKTIIINNVELKNTITDFYQAIREIETKHTIGLKSIYRFIRRLYYDWNLKQETTFVKLQQIQQEFDIELKQLLIETLGNIFHDFDIDEYQRPLSAKFAEIINAIKTNDKNEKLKSYQTKIHQLIIPSFLCNIYRAELNEIVKQTQRHSVSKSFHDISQLQQEALKNLNDPSRPYYSLNVNGVKTEIVSFSKSNDSNQEYNKLVSSIYGCGKVEKLIERLGKAKSRYTLFLYSIEEKAFQYYRDKYHESLNKEYTSSDRYTICGVEFKDEYYKYSTFDEWLEDFFSYKTDTRETENYKITFTDSSRVKIPATKTVLKVENNEEHLVLVEDLNTGDNVRIYENPDKDMLRTIFELKNPELKAKADEYSMLWRTCLNDAYLNNFMAEPLYHQLVRNHFSVSELTFRKYLEGEVMFPRSFSDLIIIAKTINDQRLSFDFLKNTMKPKIEEYRGKEIEYGFKFSNSINHFIISGEAETFISEWLTTTEIENIASQIQVRTIKDIELITQNNDD